MNMVVYESKEQFSSAFEDGEEYSTNCLKGRKCDRIIVFDREIDNSIFRVENGLWLVPPVQAFEKERLFLNIEDAIFAICDS